MAAMGLPGGDLPPPPPPPPEPPPLLPPTPPVVSGDADRCSYQGCPAAAIAPCSYVDRRQRPCPTAWCSDHQHIAFGASYCRRHAGIIEAVGMDHAHVPLPDLDNRAPSLANW